MEIGSKVIVIVGGTNAAQQRKLAGKFKGYLATDGEVELLEDDLYDKTGVYKKGYVGRFNLRFVQPAPKA